MNKNKKNRPRCMTCPHAVIFPCATDRSRAPQIECSLSPGMKIDRHTRQPDWCRKDAEKVNEQPETGMDISEEK